MLGILLVGMDLTQPVQDELCIVENIWLKTNIVTMSSWGTFYVILSE